jgi:hypothetical protein
MNRLRTDSLKLIIDDGRWMSVRAGGKHPFGGLHSRRVWSERAPLSTIVYYKSCAAPTGHSLELAHIKNIVKYWTIKNLVK